MNAASVISVCSEWQKMWPQKTTVFIWIFNCLKKAEISVRVLDTHAHAHTMIPSKELMFCRQKYTMLRSVCLCSAIQSPPHRMHFLETRLCDWYNCCDSRHPCHTHACTDTNQAFYTRFSFSRTCSFVEWRLWCVTATRSFDFVHPSVWCTGDDRWLHMSDKKGGSQYDTFLWRPKDWAQKRFMCWLRFGTRSTLERSQWGVHLLFRWHSVDQMQSICPENIQSCVPTD